MITGDNPLTAAAIAAEAGVDDFLAQATPEAKLELIRKHQAGGRLVAMTGDGTNDAPALAQADVAVAMNSGTQAAKEAGNMVDLDSNPTKLIEIVETGKQMLITRGALTTFSIANDVAKYFAIIPAAFATTYPALGALNIMHLATPTSAILSAVIFNALIIIALIPLALRGIRYRPIGAAALLRNNLLIYGVGGVLLPFPGIKLDRHDSRGFAPGLSWSDPMRSELRPALLSLVLLTILTGAIYPVVVTGIGHLVFPAPGRGKPHCARRQAGRLGADRPALRRSEVLLEPAVRHQSGVQWRGIRGVESRTDEPRAHRCDQGSGRQPSVRPIPVPRARCRSTWSPARGAGWIRTSRRPRPPTR